LDTASTSREKLARLMVGREVLFQTDQANATPGPLALQVRGIKASNDKGLPALNDISFELHAREVLGVAGVSGNGQRELAEVLTGLRKPSAGQFQLYGEDLTFASVRTMLDAGVAHIPEDRMEHGLALPLSIAENTVLHSYRQPQFTQGLFLNYAQIKQHARQLSEEFDVRTPSVDVPARNLSGGNLQKVILARELSRSPKFIVANQPTRGLDVGSCEYVRKRLIQARDQGAAVLLISEDLDEVLDVADRIAVIFEGRLTPAAAGADTQTLGLMMAGEAVPA